MVRERNAPVYTALMSPSLPLSVQAVFSHLSLSHWGTNEVSSQAPRVCPSEPIGY